MESGPEAIDESAVMRALRDALSADDAEAVRVAIWPLLEPMIDAAITHRILQFHQAMASRGEISPPWPEADDSDAVH